MWSYFGAKSRIIKVYPKPVFDKIIEPFAGSGRYALEYFEKDILLVDKYEVVAKIWLWLQKCSVNDVMKLTIPAKGTVINEQDYDCEEMAWLMGFMIARVQCTPAHTVTSFGLERFEYDRKRIASQLFKIRHWKIKHGSYEDIENESATWFIDPPYQFGGKTYKESNRRIDFINLAEWCRERLGQAIVCENDKATWLPFSTMISQVGIAKVSNEMIWTNYHTHFDNVQLKMEMA